MAPVDNVVDPEFGMTEIETSSMHCMTFPVLPAPCVDRSSYIARAQEILDNSRMAIVTGGPSIGKTILLAQFAQHHPRNALSVFLTPGALGMTSPNFIRRELFTQAWYLLEGRPPDDSSEPTEDEYLTVFSRLGRRARQALGPVFFIIDAFGEQPRSLQQEILRSVLPLGLAQDQFKYLFSAREQPSREGLDLLPAFQELQLTGFSRADAIEFFSEGQWPRQSVEELVEATADGHPGRLAVLLRELRAGVDLPQVINLARGQFHELIGLQWNRVATSDEIHRVLASIAYSRFDHSDSEIAAAASVAEDQLRPMLSAIPFVEAARVGWRFASPAHQEYARDRYKHLMPSVVEGLAMSALALATSPGRVEAGVAYLADAQRNDQILEILEPALLARTAAEESSFAVAAQLSRQGLGAARALGRFGSEVRMTVMATLSSDLQFIRGQELSTSINLRLGRFEEARQVAASCPIVSERLVLLARIGRVQKSRTGALLPGLMDAIESYLAIDPEALDDDELVDVGADLLFLSPQLAVRFARRVEESAALVKRNEMGFLSRVTLAARPLIRESELPGVMEVVLSELESDRERLLVTALTGSGAAPLDFDSLEALIAEEGPGLLDALWYIVPELIRVTPSATHDVLEGLFKGAIREASYRVPRIRLLSRALSAARRWSRDHPIGDFRVRIDDLLDAEPGTPQLDAMELRVAGLAAILPQLSPEARKGAVTDAMKWSVRSEDPSLVLEGWTHLFWLVSVSMQDLPDTFTKPLRDECVAKIEELAELVLINSGMHEDALGRPLRIVARTDLQFALLLAERANTQVRREILSDLAVVEHLQSHYSDRSEIGRALAHFEALPTERLGFVLEAFIAALHSLDDIDSSARDQLVAWALKHVCRLPIGEERAALLVDMSNLPFWGSDDGIAGAFGKLAATFASSLDGIPQPWKASRLLAAFARRPATSSVVDAELDTRATTLAASTTIATDRMTWQYVVTLKLVVVALSIAAEDGLVVDEHLLRLRAALKRLPAVRDRVEVLEQLALRLWRVRAPGWLVEEVQGLLLSQLDIVSEPPTVDDIKALHIALPALYVTSPQVCSATMGRLPEAERRAAWVRIADTLIRRRALSEPFADEPDELRLDFDSASQLVDVLRHLELEAELIRCVEFVVRCFDRYPDAMPQAQKRIVLRNIREVTTEKLPAPEGVPHDGYRIWLDALLIKAEGSLKGADLDGLRKRARSINNKSDKVFVLSILGELASRQEDTRSILLEAEEASSNVTVGFERVGRLASIAKAHHESNDVDSAKRVLRAVWPTVNQDSDRTNTLELARRSSLDLAYSISPDFARELADLLDADEARVYRKRAERRTRELELRRSLLSHNGTWAATAASNTDWRERAQAVWEAVGRLNAGRAVPKNPADALAEVGGMATQGLKQGFPALAYLMECIAEHPGRKIGRNAAARELLDALLDSAEYLHHAFVAIQGRSDFSSNRLTSSDEDLVFQKGERDKALRFLRNWLAENVTQRVVLCDPYFRAEDTEFLELCLNSCPRVPVVIITSPEAQKGTGDDVAEAFEAAWRSRYDHAPPSCTVHVVGIRKSRKSPFHDRYLFGDTRAIMLGNSFSALGGDRASTIESISDSTHSRLVADLVVPTLKHSLTIAGHMVTRQTFELL